MKREEEKEKGGKRDGKGKEEGYKVRGIGRTDRKS